MPPLNFFSQILPTSSTLITMNAPSLVSKNRCLWPGSDPLMLAYHDTEWGVPEHNDRKIFELLILDNAQAGLSWTTILKKRENYRKALDNFQPEKIALYSEAKYAQLMADSGIIRNKLKIKSHIRNAQVFLKIQKEFGNFDSYIWKFVEGKPITNHWTDQKMIPDKTPLAEEISSDIKRRGMNFVGSTIIYAWMQSIGLVNDHLVSCFRHSQIASTLK